MLTKYYYIFRHFILWSILGYYPMGEIGKGFHMYKVNYNLKVRKLSKLVRLTGVVKVQVHESTASIWFGTQEAIKAWTELTDELF